MQRATRPLAERFWEKVNKTSGCWEWTGAFASTGYGSIAVTTGHPLNAHRVSWTLAFGSIPDGMCVLHRCDNRKCVRPDHLFIGTKADNVRDMYSKGRRPKPVPRVLTHCKRGHEFTPDNTRHKKSGKRGCLTCERAAARRRYHERAA